MKLRVKYAQILADEYGYSGSSGPGTGEAVVNKKSAGGSYGGLGGMTSGEGGRGEPYGSVTEPALLGSGGGNNYFTSSVLGGIGGGGIHIVAGGSVVINGAISANGGTGNAVYASCGGGGAGGSIWIKASQFSGSGTLSANGGSGGSNQWGNANGGSGGRIAIDATQNQFSGALTTFGGSGLDYGGPGTVYFTQEDKLVVNNNSHEGYAGLIGDAFDFALINLKQNADLYVSQNATLTLQANTLQSEGNTTLWIPGTLTLPAAYTLPGNTLVNVVGKLDGVSQLTIPATSELQLYANSSLHSGAYTFERLTIASNGLLKLYPYDNGDSDFSNDSPFELRANQIQVAEGGKISADGLGYSGTNSNGRGPGAGVGETTGGRYGGGGSYGGLGGNNYSDVAGGAVYGSMQYPIDLGSSGGSGESGGIRNGMGGGGALHLIVDGTLEVNGAISANGLGNLLTAGSGAGGSLWVEAGQITGSGSFSALGGSATNSAGAGGGRIAVYSDNLGANISFNAEGGQGIRNGATGTVFMGRLDPSQSTVTLTPGEVPTDGSSQATITVTLKNAQGQPVAGKPVEIALAYGKDLKINGSSAETNQYVSIGTSNSQGQVSATLSAESSGERTLKVRSGQDMLSAQAVVTFVPGPVDITQSKIETNAAQVPANGTSRAEITITVLDRFGNPIPNATVTLQTTGSAKISQPENPSDLQGQTKATISDEQVETVTITAAAGGVTLTANTAVQFTGTDLQAGLSASANSAANGSIVYELYVKNTSALSAKNTTLTLELPGDTSLAAQNYATPPQVNGQLYTWTIGDLEPNAQINILATALVGSTVPGGSTLSAHLTAASDTPDQNESDNSASADTHTVDAFAFAATLAPGSADLVIGGSAQYTLRIQNSGFFNDTFDLQISGLDASWVTLSDSTLSLAPGAFGEATLTVASSACQAEASLPFTVTLHSHEGDQDQILNAALNLVQNPVITLDAPGENITSGSRAVTFAWHTNPASQATLKVYPAGHPEQAQSFSSEEATIHSVVVQDLERNHAYEWTVEAVSDCGQSVTSARTFTVGNGIVFLNHQASYTIERDYDQRVQVDVRNDDSNPHTLTADVFNAYEDLIVNFVDSGSIDQTITLQPGETRQVTLAIHAQDAALRDYQLTAHLVADRENADPITDNAVLDVKVLFAGDYTIVEDTTVFDPLTLGKTYVITNHGKVITDLSLEAIDPDTGEPAEVFIQPNLDHVRLETGQSIRVVVYPLFGAADAAQSTAANTDSERSIQLAAYYPKASSPQSAQAEKKFTLVGNGAGNTVNVAGSSSCPTGNQIYPVQLSNVTCSFTSSDWYCTNRPQIVTPILIPAFLNQASLKSASLGIQFTPHNDVQPHNGAIRVNGAQIGSFNNAIPSGQYSFPIPIENLTHSIAGLATENIQLDTQHNNSGHYVSSSNYVLGLNVNQATTYACAASAEAAKQAILSTYSCGSTQGFDPWTDVYNGSTQNLGEIKKLIKENAADNGYQISSISCTQSDCGDPINTRTGVFSIALPDLSFPTTAGDLVFQRAYSSGTTDTDTDRLGYGWTHNHAAGLIFPSDPDGMEGFVIFKDVLGNRYLFGIQSDGTYRPGPGVLASLTKSGATPVSYTLLTPEQAKLEFDESGKITSRSNALGHSFIYSYDTQNRLSRVGADQGERYFDLAYDSQNRIISVTDYSGRAITYTYDAAGDLVSSTDLLAREWTYTYDSAHRMTQVVDPSDKETVTTEYDMNGRSYRQFDGEGNLIVRIVYNSDGSTTVYDANGNAQTYQSNEHNVVTATTDALNQPTNTVFDANFRPTSVTNAAGSTLGLEWSTDGTNLLAKTDPAGNRTVNTYDELNNLTSSTDPLGNVTTYTYNGKLLTAESDAEGKTTTYTYTSEGYLASQTDSYGNTTTYTYDSHGQRTSVTNSEGKATSYTYDQLGRLTETRDARGRVTRNEYNAAGQLLRSIRNYDANRPQNDETLYNIITTYEYDTRGNQTAVTDTLGRVTRYEYDDADRLVRTIDAAGNATSNIYAADGLLSASKDALNHATTYVYDATGRRLSTINALGQSSGTTTFNITANSATATDALGNSATYYYDANNRVIKVVDGLGNFTTSTYNANGNVVGRTDQLGRTTSYEYDALNRLVRTTDPLGGINETVYDTEGKRVASIDPMGNRTSYTYDDKGRLTVTTDALGNSTTNEYDDDGNLIAATDPLGRVTRSEYDEWGRRAASIDAAGRRTTYTYDALDRVTGMSDPTGTTTTTYDALGNVTARTDIYGRTAATTYDDLGRTVSSTDFDGNTTTNTYNAVGSLVSTTDSLGNTTSYTYDALNRRIAATDSAGNTSRTEYDALGNVTAEINANGVVTHYVYDVLNRKTAVIQNYRPAFQPNADTNVRIEFTYNAVGNRTQVKDANGNSTTFEYDALNRVTKKIDPLGNTWQYTYDLAGNRTAMTDGNGQEIHFSYDANGQLTLIDYPDPDADVSFTYDAAGQRTAMTDGLGTTAWVYDALGRLTSSRDPHGKTVAYSYDSFGNRSGLTYADGKQAAYTYDADNRLAQVADWSTQTTEYEYDSLGRLLSTLRPNEVDSSYSYDDTGRLAQLEHISAMGSLAAYQYTYDALGNVTRAVERVSGGAAGGPTVKVTVTDTSGAPLAGVTVYAFTGSTYTHYSKATDTQGQASITLPDGMYRFRVDVDGTQFWSGSENHCQIGKCGPLNITIPQPVLVAVLDTDGTPQEGLTVYAFNGAAYTNFSGRTNAEGQVSLRLPNDASQSSYRFRADFNGTQFWSGPQNHCTVPACTMAAVRVTTPVSVLVKDNMGMPQSGISVYAFNGTTYTNYSAVTNADGQAVFTLPEGSYHFRADFNSTQFWSSTTNECTLPGCTHSEITVNKPFTVSVKDTDGAPMADLSVYVFDGTTYKNFSAKTNTGGEVTFTLPAGSYRFRADFNSTQFWSGTANHCTVPSCPGAAITVTKPLTVTVKDTDGTAMANLNVYAFDGTTYKNFSAKTNTNGEVIFTLPAGSYRFRADFNSTQFWSGTANHCSLPGCESAEVTVTKPLTVAVLNPDGSAAAANINVYAFDGATYKNFSAVTNANGQAVFTLPQGNYRFRADYNNVQYWSGTQNHCSLPGCESLNLTLGTPVVPTATVTPTETATAAQTATETPVPSDTPEPTATETETPIPTETQQTGSLSSGIVAAAYRPYNLQPETTPAPLTVTVKDTDGTAKAGLNVYAFNGTTYTGVSGVGAADGTVQFNLPANSEGYRFRADLNGTQFWSGSENHCTLPDCTAVEITVSKPLTVTVKDSDGSAKTGLNVYAFDGTTYKNFNAITDVNGQAVFTLPAGNYRFRADVDGTQFWSAETNTCTLPGCTAVDITVTKPLTVTVKDTDGSAKAGLNVYAFDGTTYKNFSAITDVNGQAVFTLPAGNYRFRADVDGTQFWSAETNTCTLPGCTAVDITVSKPLTVTVAGKNGDPYPNLPVYAFSGTAYTGFSGMTDANGRVTLTLPQGSYRFRSDYDGVQFWSGETDTCTLPGCEAASVTLPGGSGERNVTIDYQYDALNRLTGATYDNGMSFTYTYDPAGNVLEYVLTHAGQTVTTTYTYDAANQLLTATQGSVVWHYSYDGNGSLIQSTPGENEAAGAKRYTYSIAGFLTKVEHHDGTGWQTQAEMRYDGLGNRLEMVGYAGTESVTTQYELDNGRVLAAASGENSTFYLYGLGAIGEQTDAWSYSLPDGTGTPRQIVNANGEVTLVTSYTPWGDTLETYGTGNFSYGYFGGLMDTATGLLYVGNGMYYDPQTGRFLNRNVHPEQTNPYVPWGDPAGAMVAPLALLALVFTNKKKRTKLDYWIIALVLGLSVGMSLTGIGSVAAASVTPSTYAGDVETPPGPLYIPFPTTIGYEGPYAMPPSRGILTIFGSCYKLPPDSRYGLNGDGSYWRNFDPAIQPLNITWSPDAHIPLSPILGIGKENSQFDISYRVNDGLHLQGKNAVRYGENYCGQISLSMIAAKYGFGDYFFYQIYLSADSTNEPTGVSQLAKAGAISFSIPSPRRDWKASAYSANSSYTYKTSGLPYVPLQDHRTLNSEWFEGADNPAIPIFDNLSNYFRSSIQYGHNFVVLTKLSSGIGYPTLHNRSGIDHWVVLNAMSGEWDMNDEFSPWNWVKINNPFNNRFEYYPWKYFKESMVSSGNILIDIRY